MSRHEQVAASPSPRYRTIVCDPPWDYADGFGTSSHNARTGRRWNAKRTALPYQSMTVIDAARGRRHSTKPDCFMDYIELASPSPRLEMFARRQRLGWDTWGNEALGHVELSA